MILSSVDTKFPGKDIGEAYQLLRALFTMAQSDSTTKSELVGPFWSINSTSTQEGNVMTEYIGKDGSRIRAESWGERMPSGILRHHTFTYWGAPMTASPECRRGTDDGP